MLEFEEAFQAMILYIAYQTVNQIQYYLENLTNAASTRLLFMFWDTVHSPLDDFIKDAAMFYWWTVHKNTKLQDWKKYTK